MKYILLILMLCSFTVNAGMTNAASYLKDGCGISHVVPHSQVPGRYAIHYYCINSDGSADLDWSYIDEEGINWMFNDYDDVYKGPMKYD